MSDCDHRWSLMRVPYECPYCLRERAEHAEAECANLRGDLTVVRNVLAQADQRAERAEAERDAVAVANCPRLCAEFCNEYQTQQALERAEAERDALRALLRERCPECNGTGQRDSGGTHPWGEPALLPCDHGIDAALGEKP